MDAADDAVTQVDERKVSVLAASGLVGVLSLFNMGGRFVWASQPDYIDHKMTYVVFLLLGAILFFLLPAVGTVPLLVLIAGVLISRYGGRYGGMYGGGFSASPAYLKDLFGVVNVSAIHRRLLTAGSTAGILGPLIVNALLDRAVTMGQPLRLVYPLVLHTMAGLLVLGLVADLPVHPVAERYWVREGEAVLADVGGY